MNYYLKVRKYNMGIIEIPDNEPKKQKDFIGFDDMTEIKEFTDEPVEENKNEKI